MDKAPLQPEGINTPGGERELEATIALLKQHFEMVRRHEVKRVRGRLGQLSSMQENAIESLTHSIVDQIMETPITVLEGASEGRNSLAVIETVRRVFNLNTDADRRHLV